MTFPAIKRADWPYSLEDIKKERKSRAVWARALANKLQFFNRDGKIPLILMEVVNELLLEAGKDEK